jgi:mono/diheme cytochrome c family protein/GNAT superfamily N-acetyltransferase
VEELLTKDEIADVTQYVLNFSGRAEDTDAVARAAETWEYNCAACHGEQGMGNTDLGAPNLTDGIWLYGGDQQSIYNQIWKPQHGVMPPWIKKLGEAQVKELAVYVHSLGGGSRPMGARVKREALASMFHSRKNFRLNATISMTCALARMTTPHAASPGTGQPLPPSAPHAIPDRQNSTRRQARERTMTEPQSLTIRPAKLADDGALWTMLEPVIRAGETYALPRDMTREAALAFWRGPDRATFLALDDAGPVGTYYLKANQQGGGAHVVNCGYVTAARARGQGVASRLRDHSFDEARARGFRAMQFNFVIATNEGAIRLWERSGFAVVGRLPGAFDHPAHGLVDALVMHRWL